MRWDLIDQFEVLKKGSHSSATKFLSGKEDFFLEHYPGRPMVPQTLCIEMIAQTGGVLVGLGVDFKKEVILAKVEKAEFSRSVAPPCELKVSAKIEEVREEGAWVSGTVLKGQEECAKARLLLVTVDSLDASFKRPIVFNDHFLKHYDIYRVAQRSEEIR